MLTVAEAAQRVRRTPGMVRRWIRGGRLRAETTDSRLLIDPGALEEVRKRDVSNVAAAAGMAEAGGRNACAELGCGSGAVAARSLSGRVRCCGG